MIQKKHFIDYSDELDMMLSPQETNLSCYSDVRNAIDTVQCETITKKSMQSFKTYISDKGRSAIIIESFRVDIQPLIVLEIDNSTIYIPTESYKWFGDLRLLIAVLSPKSQK